MNRIFFVNSCHHILVKIGINLFLHKIFAYVLTAVSKLCFECDRDWFIVSAYIDIKHFFDTYFTDIAKFDLLIFTL